MSGWQAWPDPSGNGWKWAAYGQRGGTHGMAASKDEAESKARAAENDLRQPFAPLSESRQPEEGVDA